MRAVGLSDLDLAARAVMSVPPNQQMNFAERLLEEAHLSDLWCKRIGTAHASGGTGSLYMQASVHNTVPLKWSDSAYCGAFCIILQALEAWRERTHKIL